MRLLAYTDAAGVGGAEVSLANMADAYRDLYDELLKRPRRHRWRPGAEKA